MHQHGDIQLVAGPERKQAHGSDRKLMLPSRPPTAASSTALVKYTPLVFKEEEEDIKIKLRRILKNFPVRFSNTSGSSAGSPLATSIRYDQTRQKEQDRIARMDVDYQRRKEAAEFNMRREERLREAKEKIAKKRLKHKKKNQRKKEKKMKTNSGGEEKQKEESLDNDGNPDDQTEQACTKF
ncbi:uncharacterized protein LOC126584270 [Malus sylvestris]|uniref:uncharacterized protein LOC126584270 n=1 Tax=Malus sylvestris TaxID=3752 RepID=UPI0021AC663C|nr:uncharacterized protein LOC126584270 [Malus sylvestris]